MSDDDLLIREATEADVDGIHEVFRAVYGSGYPHQRFIEPAWLRRSVYTDDVLMLAGIDRRTDRVIGSASVVFDVGAHTDLIGEFGRLVVHPDVRNRGIGRRLMEARLSFVQDRLHVGVVENRCRGPFSQKISERHGFVAVGFMPLRHRFVERENIALYVRHFGDALTLRCNNPRVVPEVHPAAHLALSSCGLQPDCIVDEDAPAYPRETGFRVEELTMRGMPAVLRIERGRVRRREVFGPMRLQYGFFRLSARQATYLIAYPSSAPTSSAPVMGAIGFIRDEFEKSVRVFELIAGNDDVVFTLLSSLLDRCRDQWGIEYVDIDVSAHAPRMQRTLIELGFIPSAYVPAMVFHEVERLDVVRMSRVLVEPELGDFALVPGSQTFADGVIKAITRQHVLPRLQEALHRLELFRGLNQEQQHRLAAQCQVVSFDAGAELFRRGEPADRMFVIIEGEADIRMERADGPVGSVGVGELVGERATLVGEPHSATAVARRPMVTASISLASMAELTRRRPDIGVIVYRNLAVALGTKLQRMHAWVSPDDDLTV